jgi:DNA-binding Xre family transcriptional regulator
VVIYAYSDIYKKYVGTLADSSLTTKELAAKFGIPMNNCHLIDITSEGNYSETILKKLSEKV